MSSVFWLVYMTILHPEVNNIITLFIVVSIEQSEYRFGPDDAGNDVNILIQLIKVSDSMFPSGTLFTATPINFSLDEGMPYS